MKDWTSGYILQEEAEALLLLSKENHFVTRFGFLLAHNGLRKGCIHTVLGVSHGGKSTLVRTILLDVLLNNKSENVGYWASEESVEEFQVEFYSSGIKGKLLKNLFIFSELGVNKQDRELLLLIEKFIKENNLSVLIVDNITTSQFYMDKGNSVQPAVLKYFKSLAAKLNIPIVLIAHTGAGVTENYSGIIEMNDIRGNKSIVNLSHFFYIMQSFYINARRVNTLRVTKHRGHIVQSPIWNLEYSAERKAFVSDSSMDFKRFKEVYKDRNRL